MKHVIGLLAFLFVLQAEANVGVTYHGRLLDSSGNPVTASMVQFKIEIRTPGTENCLLYSETHNRDMTSSDGVFAITVNDGTAASVNTEPFTLDRVFQNRGTFSFGGGKCSVGSTYTPNPADGRKLQVYFNDGSFTGWEALPSQAINHVPASIESMTVGGFAAGSLVRVTDGSGTPQSVSALTTTQFNKLVQVADGTGDIAGNAAGFTGSLTGDVTGTQGATVVSRIQGRNVDTAAPSDGQVLKWHAGNNRWEPATDAGGSGTVTSVAVNAPITNSGTATALNLSISDASTSAKGIVQLATNGGTTAGTVVQADDLRLSNARTPTAHTHAVDEITSAATKYFTYQPNGSACGANQVLKWISNRWECANDDSMPANFGIGDLKTNLGAAQFTQASCAAHQTLTWSSLTDAFSCTNIAGLNASAISAGTISSARLGSGTADATTYLRGDGTWAAVSGSKWSESGGDVYRTTGNVGIGTTTPGQKLSVAGTIESTTGGFKFPDGTVQTSAASGGGTAPSYGFFTLSADQTANIASGNHIEFNTAIGNIALETGSGQTNGRWTLSAGKTYSLTASLSVNASSNNMTLSYAFYNVTENVVVGTTAQAVSEGYTSWASSLTRTAQAIVTPTADSVFELRIFFVANATAILKVGSAVMVQTINGTGGSSPWALGGSSISYSSGNVGIGTSTPQSALQVSGYVQLDTVSGVPPSMDCDSANERGRMKVDSASGALYVCMNSGWVDTAQSSVPAGTVCGSRIAYCSTAISVGYDPTVAAYGGNSNAPCQGVSLTTTCSGWTIGVANNCPSGYTGHRQSFEDSSSPIGILSRIFCVKN